MMITSFHDDNYNVIINNYEMLLLSLSLSLFQSVDSIRQDAFPFHLSNVLLINYYY